jgi:hypothetical protein
MSDTELRRGLEALAEELLDPDAETLNSPGDVADRLRALLASTKEDEAGLWEAAEAVIQQWQVVPFTDLRMGKLIAELEGALRLAAGEPGYSVLDGPNPTVKFDPPAQQPKTSTKEEPPLREELPRVDRDSRLDGFICQPMPGDPPYKVWMPTSAKEMWDKMVLALMPSMAERGLREALMEWLEQAESIDDRPIAKKIRSILDAGSFPRCGNARLDCL